MSKKKNWRKIVVDGLEYHWSIIYYYDYQAIKINLNKKPYLTMNINITESITPSFIRYCILDDNIEDTGKQYGSDDYVSDILVGWNAKRLRENNIK